MRESNGYGSSRADLSSLAGSERDVPLADRHRLHRPTTTAGSSTTSGSSPAPSPDTTAPQTTITKHPKKKTFSHKAKFIFKSSEPGSTFKCKLDKKKWKSCTSPKKYKNLKVGKHKFRVYAIDAAGNADPTPAVWKWKIKP